MLPHLPAIWHDSDVVQLRILLTKYVKLIHSGEIMSIRTARVVHLRKYWTGAKEKTVVPRQNLSGEKKFGLYRSKLNSYVARSSSLTSSSILSEENAYLIKKDII